MRPAPVQVLPLPICQQTAAHPPHDDGPLQQLHRKLSPATGPPPRSPRQQPDVNGLVPFEQQLNVPPEQQLFAGTFQPSFSGASLISDSSQRCFALIFFRR